MRLMARVVISVLSGGCNFIVRVVVVFCDVPGVGVYPIVCLCLSSPVFSFLLQKPFNFSTDRTSRSLQSLYIIKLEQTTSLCVCLSLSVLLSLSLYLRVSVCLPICQSISLPGCLCLPICLSLSLWQ